MGLFLQVRNVEKAWRVRKGRTIRYTLFAIRSNCHPLLMLLDDLIDEAIV
jgi:hypothetical protein